ncbi:hypothetical protein PV04_00144 [Phialophora macrospora]|uniref:Uncharacterized protein n=1 Tax=Phialophora macrospora TaxID=1851006 RepID=A0A0D2ECC2_9EURO|nr:hypothetical protein PV04_00144 [Phialophora macrospora]
MNIDVCRVYSGTAAPLQSYLTAQSPVASTDHTHISKPHLAKVEFEEVLVEVFKMFPNPFKSRRAAKAPKKLSNEEAMKWASGGSEPGLQPAKNLPQIPSGQIPSDAKKLPPTPLQEKDLPHIPSGQIPSDAKKLPPTPTDPPLPLPPSVPLGDPRKYKEPKPEPESTPYPGTGGPIEHHLGDDGQMHTALPVGRIFPPSGQSGSSKPAPATALAPAPATTAGTSVPTQTTNRAPPVQV